MKLPPIYVLLCISCIVSLLLLPSAAGWREGWHSSQRSYYRRTYNRRPHYVYTLNLEDGRKYVGRTQYPDQRIAEHFAGTGARWTQRYRPASIESITGYSSEWAARRGETDTYYEVRNTYGSDVVRGAGRTTSYERDELCSVLVVSSRPPRDSDAQSCFPSHPPSLPAYTHSQQCSHVPSETRRPSRIPLR